MEELVIRLGVGALTLGKLRQRITSYKFQGKKRIKI